MAAPNARLHEAMNQHLFPTITYGVNSGGDPKEIPHLTYAELIEFHKKFYHPSRCLFFFYGNLPLEKHLTFIEEHALQVDPLPPLKRLDKQPRLEAPVTYDAPYPIGKEEETKEKTWISLGWLTCDIQNQEEALALSMLEIILMDNDASPLKRALQHSGFCKQASAYLEEDMSELPWILTCQGCEADDADALEEFILEELTRIAEEGFPEDIVEMALHQLELQRSEISGDHYPFGLVLFMRSALLKQHGVAPENGLTLHQHFSRIRQQLREDPDYLSKLVQRYFIDNPHRVRIVLYPDKELVHREKEAEEAVLQKLQEELTEEERKNLVLQATRLADHQKALEGNLDVLPKIRLSDVPKESRDFFLNVRPFDALTTYHHSAFTNGITYAEFHFPLPHLEPEEISYLPLFVSLVTQMGSGGRSYIETLQYMQAHTGGIGAALGLHSHVEDHRRCVPSITLRGKCLDRKGEFLFPLFMDTLKGVSWSDRERLKELIYKQATSIESRINQMAMRYAIQLSSSALNLGSHLAFQWFGLPYLVFLRDLVAHLDERLDDVSEKLFSLHNKLFHPSRGDLVITCDEDMGNLLYDNEFFGLKNFPYGKESIWEWYGKPSPVITQGRKISSSVAFIAKVFETVSYVDPSAVALNVASFLFDNLVLHPRIREQGGAYGGGAAANALAGSFTF